MYVANGTKGNTSIDEGNTLLNHGTVLSLLSSQVLEDKGSFRSADNSAEILLSMSSPSCRLELHGVAYVRATTTVDLYLLEPPCVYM